MERDVSGSECEHCKLVWNEEKFRIALLGALHVEQNALSFGAINRLLQWAKCFAEKSRNKDTTEAGNKVIWHCV